MLIQSSSIDFETDVKIQEALREEFGASCVITIAHRLQTIMDYDRVVRYEFLYAPTIKLTMRHRLSWMLASLLKTARLQTLSLILRGSFTRCVSKLASQVPSREMPRRIGSINEEFLLLLFKI